jgi:hypothetical protein
MIAHAVEVRQYGRLIQDTDPYLLPPAPYTQFLESRKPLPFRPLRARDSDASGQRGDDDDDDDWDVDPAPQPVDLRQGSVAEFAVFKPNVDGYTIEKLAAEDRPTKPPTKRPLVSAALRVPSAPWRVQCD